MQLKAAAERQPETDSCLIFASVFVPKAPTSNNNKNNNTNKLKWKLSTWLMQKQSNA